MFDKTKIDSLERPSRYGENVEHFPSPLVGLVICHLYPGMVRAAAGSARQSSSRPIFELPSGRESSVLTRIVQALWTKLSKLTVWISGEHRLRGKAS